MNRLITINKPKSPISEIYRGIRTSIEFSNLDKKIKVINITSSKSNEGKTTIISNLAVSFASLEKKVLIIDGDLRNPGVHKMFGISNIIGLTDVLVGNHDFVEAVHCTDTKNLHVLTCGPIPPNPSEMLASNKMKKFVEEMREEYDYVFIDAPPIGLVTDAGIIGGYSDGCIFVVGSQETNIDMIKMAKEKLDSVGVNIIGSVLNKYDIKKSTQGYYDYYYVETRMSKRKAKKAKKKREKEEKSMVQS